MNKVLFISESAVYGSTFSNALKEHLDITIHNGFKENEVDQFDIIVLDHSDDINKSRDIIDRIHQEIGFKDIPILLTATKAQTSDATTLLTAGATGIMLKPFDTNIIYPNIMQALKPVGNMKKMDVELINPFIQGTVDVIEKMTHTEIKRTGLILKKNYTMFGDLSGAMDIHGHLQGRIAITFRADLAAELVAQMLDIPSEKLEVSEIHAGVEEIINMISGNAKNLLSESTHNFEISLPKLELGFGNRISSKTDEPFYVAMFEAMDKTFAIQLCAKTIVNENKIENDGNKELARS